MDQCVQGEGLVQVNVRLKSEGKIHKINIEDVLKPAEEGDMEDEDSQGKSSQFFILSYLTYYPFKFYHCSYIVETINVCMITNTIVLRF